MHNPFSSTLNIVNPDNLIVIIGIPEINADDSFSLNTTMRTTLLTEPQSQILDALYVQGAGSNIGTIPQDLHQETTHMLQDGLIEIFSTTVSTVFKENYVPKLLMNLDETTVFPIPDSNLIKIINPRTGQPAQLPALLLDGTHNFTPDMNLEAVVHKTAKNIVENKLNILVTDDDYEPAIEDFTFQLRTVILIATQMGIIGLDLMPVKAPMKQTWNKVTFRKN